MIQVDPVNGFYGRHVRDQTYIVIANIASMNMAVGKIPFIDCMTIRQLRDDTVRRFMEQPAFVGYPRYLVHFVCEEDECYQRCVRRAQTDPHAAVRDAKKIVSREAFHKFVTEEQPMLPKELARYKHLVINTSEGNPTECAEKLIEYIQNEN
jgi:hypothetical protein